MPTLVLLTGCSAPAPETPRNLPDAYSQAYAVPDCAPWDGPAVTVYFARTVADSQVPVFPRLRVSIWKPPADVQGRTFRWPNDIDTGVAVHCASDDSCQPVQGAISFGAAASDGALSGELSLLLTSGDSVRGRFRAPLRALRQFCG